MAPRKGGKKNQAPDQQEQKNHIKENRAVFTKSGFSRVPGVSDKEFTFKDRKGDLDDIFIYEKVIVLAEYTTTKSSNISSHIYKKKVLFDLILENQNEFIDYLDKKFPTFKERRGDRHHVSQYKIKILYSSLNKIEDDHKKQLNNIYFFEYPVMKYFLSVSKAVKKSARFELFKFFELDSVDVQSPGGGGSKSITYAGSLLPEAHSNFDSGFKVVSFYVDPEALLSRSYVLRKDGWRDGDGLYQRMISESKVQNIRSYLKNKKRVFINNILVTLPSDTKIVGKDGGLIRNDELSETAPVNIQLPDRFNSVGIIDGQHRVFSYHEGGSFDEEIVKLRERQNLLVTGIIYPKGISDQRRTNFEANLFLEVNSTQTYVRSDLKQAIGLLLTPFAAASIGKRVVNTLNNSGVLFDEFERHFFDTQKLKTTSIVSYGLVPIVKLGGDDSLYSVWNHQDKSLLLKDDKEILEDYVKFCACEINKFLAAVKEVMPQDKWTTDKKVKGRLLTTTHINGFINCLRFIISNNMINDVSWYRNKLHGLEQFPFDTYHSSQYRRMGESIFDAHFR